MLCCLENTEWGRCDAHVAPPVLYVSILNASGHVVPVHGREAGVVVYSLSIVKLFPQWKLLIETE